MAGRPTAGMSAGSRVPGGGGRLQRSSVMAAFRQEGQQRLGGGAQGSSKAPVAERKDGRRRSGDGARGSSKAPVAERKSYRRCQRSRPPIYIDDIKMFTMPRKLVKSLQDPTDADSGCANKQPTSVLNSSTSDEVNWNPVMAVPGGSHSHNLDCATETKSVNFFIKLISLPLQISTLIGS